MSERENNVYKAKLAEQAERYDASIQMLRMPLRLRGGSDDIERQGSPASSDGSTSSSGTYFSAEGSVGSSDAKEVNDTYDAAGKWIEDNQDPNKHLRDQAEDLIKLAQAQGKHDDMIWALQTRLGLINRPPHSSDTQQPGTSTEKK